MSREGVQRDLLPLIEGTTVSTKHGPVKTDHILFIASGAFHIAKPSDLLPELQGRLPIRVELKALSNGRFPPHPHRARSEPHQAVCRRCSATEGVTLDFTEDGIVAIANIAAEINAAIENIGAQAASDGDGAGARRGELHGDRPLGRDGHDRCGLCREAYRRSRAQHRSVEIHPLSSAPVAFARDVPSSSSSVLLVEPGDLVGEAIGEFGGARHQAGRVDDDARMRDAGEARDILGVVPDDVEISDDALDRDASQGGRACRAQGPRDRRSRRRYASAMSLRVTPRSARSLRMRSPKGVMAFPWTRLQLHIEGTAAAMLGMGRLKA